MDKDNKDNRAPREAETREAEASYDNWRPTSLLPVPAPQNGWVFRWVRTAYADAQDTKNISTKFREGWSPVNPTEHPELKNFMSDRRSDFKDGIEIGGLLLCKMSAAKAKGRKDYYSQMNRDQVSAVENNYLSGSDSRMPKYQESRTTVSTGKRPA